MKSSYNPQEEINDLSERVISLESTVQELRGIISQMQEHLRKIDLRIGDSERTNRRMDLRVEDLQGTLAQKLRTLGQMTESRKSVEELEQELKELRRQHALEEKWRKEDEDDRRFGRIVFIVMAIIIAWVIYDARTSPPSKDYPPGEFCYDADPTYYTDIICE